MEPQAPGEPGWGRFSLVGWFRCYQALPALPRFAAVTRHSPWPGRFGSSHNTWTGRLGCTPGPSGSTSAWGVRRRRSGRHRSRMCPHSPAPHTDGPWHNRRDWRRGRYRSGPRCSRSRRHTAGPPDTPDTAHWCKLGPSGTSPVLGHPCTPAHRCWWHCRAGPPDTSPASRSGGCSRASAGIAQSHSAGP